MALETLRGLKEIGGFEVKEIEWNHPKDNFIEINHKSNAITFKIQDGPIKEYGVNGCQVDTLIETAKTIIDGLHKQNPCRENALAIAKIDEALMWLDKRKRDRITRGVEGTSQK